MSNEMSMDEMIEVLARYRYNAKHDADRIKALEDELGRMRASSFVTAVPSAEYEKLKDENTSLKAKIDELNQRWPNYHVDALIKAEAENARLKAEVERLTFDPLSYLDDQGEWMPRHTHLAAVERLKAEVERLHRAGDLMLKFACANMPYPAYATMAKDWMAVKKAKQS